jgi:hypothetical protein
LWDDEIEPSGLVGFIACFTGPDVRSCPGLEGVVFVEIASAPVALRLLGVLQQQLALETGQIVHQYNYYAGCRCPKAGRLKRGGKDGVWFCWD